MKDSFEWKRQQLTEVFPSSSSSWSPWLSARLALCVDNERFKEQLRQVQAYLNVLKTKGDIATDSRDRNQFPICGFNFSKMAGKIRTEGTCKLPRWWGLPGPPAPPGSTLWLIKVFRLIHKHHDTDLSFVIQHVISWKLPHHDIIKQHLWLLSDMWAATTQMALVLIMVMAHWLIGRDLLHQVCLSAAKWVKFGEMISRKVNLTHLLGCYFPGLNHLRQCLNVNRMAFKPGEAEAELTLLKLHLFVAEKLLGNL